MGQVPETFLYHNTLLILEVIRMTMNDEKIVIDKESLFNLFKTTMEETKEAIEDLFGGADEVSDNFYEEISKKLDQVHKNILENGQLHTEKQTDKMIKDFWGE